MVIFLQLHKTLALNHNLCHTHSALLQVPIESILLLSDQQREELHSLDNNQNISTTSFPQPSTTIRNPVNKTPLPLIGYTCLPTNERLSHHLGRHFMTTSFNCGANANIDFGSNFLVLHSTSAKSPKSKLSIH